MAFGEPRPPGRSRRPEEKLLSTDESRQTFVGWKVARLSVGLGAPVVPVAAAGESASFNAGGRIGTKLWRVVKNVGFRLRRPSRPAWMTDLVGEPGHLAAGPGRIDV
jgi:hypothetical protein